MYREVEFKMYLEGYCDAKCYNMVYGTMFKRNYTGGIANPLDKNYTPIDLGNNTTQLGNLTDLLSNLEIRNG